jgi:hypothetical protein
MPKRRQMREKYQKRGVGVGQETFLSKPEKRQKEKRYQKKEVEVGQEKIQSDKR